jgi:hypothetical protein
VQVSVDSIHLRELWHRIRDGRTRSFPERTGLGMLMTDRTRDPEYWGGCQVISQTLFPIMIGMARPLQL